MSQRSRNGCSYQGNSSRVSHPHLLKLLYTSANAAGRTFCDNTAEITYIFSTSTAARNTLPEGCPTAMHMHLHVSYNNAQPLQPEANASCIGDDPNALASHIEHHCSASQEHPAGASQNVFQSMQPLPFLPAAPISVTLLHLIGLNSGILHDLLMCLLLWFRSAFQFLV